MQEEQNTCIADRAERDRALDTTQSFIVQAPAGSGKTELLVQRYLALLARVDRPESVIAITFTRKAAGEMRRRVLKALELAAGPRPAAPHEIRTWDLARAARERDRAARWELAANPHRLEIRTIDSLCYSLVSRMPWLSRLGAPPDIVEDARDLYREAARRTVALLESEHESAAAVARLLVHVDNDVPALEALLAGMLERRDQWLRHVGMGGDRAAQREALESALQNAVEEALAGVCDAVPDSAAGELVELARFAARNLEGRASPICACRHMRALPGRGIEELPHWLGIAALLLTAEGDWRRRVNVNTGFPPEARERKQQIQNLLASLAAHEDLRVRLGELRALPPACFDDAQWEVVDALLTLLPVAAAQLEVVFRDRGAVDYSHIVLAALRALGEPEAPTDLTLALDCRIQHLLVDEFQDTSLSQFELLSKLTTGWEPGDGRTLFLVGDPMQSIYRFREAEVGLFLKAARDGIGPVPLEPLRLTVNFRSEEGIVEWVNRAFEGVFPPVEDIGTGAVRFSPSVAARGAGAAPAVEVHAFLGPSDRDEAARAVEIVRAARECDAGARIAILVRARTHLPSILLALREAGLRYRAIEIDYLAEVPLIQDLLALTRALLHLADRVSWLALLRAPWCGLTLGDLHALAAGAPDRVVWDLVRDEARVAALGADAQARLARVRRVLEDSFAGRRGGLRAWVEGTWMALGGPACVTGGSDLENARAFFDLLEELDIGRDADIDLLAERAGRLFAAPDSEAGDALQVMSIHKAKGLEFEVVLVPGLGRRVRQDEPKLLLWLERPSEGSTGELLLAPIKPAGAEDDVLYSYLKRIDRKKGEHEAGRLLYVAATRAKKRLHLLGHTGCSIENGVPDLRQPESTSLLRRIWPAVEEEFRKLERPALEEVYPEPPRLMVRRLREDWQMPSPPPSVDAPGAAAVDGEGNRPVTFLWVGDTLRHIGTVVHRMLQFLVPPQRPVCEAALKTLGVPAAELGEAADKVERALLWTLADERGRWVLDDSHAEAQSEFALTGVIDGELVSGRIDRTFVDEHGVRWIVDFKTSSHEGGDIEAFLDNERERYRSRMEIYRRLFEMLESRPIRMGIYFPLLRAWREYPAAKPGTAGGMG